MSPFASIHGLLLIEVHAQSHSSIKTFWPKIKKLLRNFEGSQAQFFKKLSGLDDQEVSYKKTECSPATSTSVNFPVKTIQEKQSQ